MLKGIHSEKCITTCELYKEYEKTIIEKTARETKSKRRSHYASVVKLQSGDLCV